MTDSSVSIIQKIQLIEANLETARDNTERQAMRSVIRKLQFQLEGRTGNQSKWNMR